MDFAVTRPRHWGMPALKGALHHVGGWRKKPRPRASSASLRALFDTGPTACVVLATISVKNANENNALNAFPDRRPD